MIPRATYCQPRIASFGWTETQTRERGLDVRVAKFPFSANGKAYGLGDTARNAHAHPTLGEAVKEAVHGLAGHMINM